MSHEVETMVSRRIEWHHAETDHEVHEAPMTAKECLVLAGLDWEVELLPIFTELPDGTRVSIEGNKAVVRDSDNKFLGVVGSKYKAFQNRQCFEHLDALVDDGSAKYETAGSLLGGKQVFITMKLPDQILVGGIDPVDVYLACLTSHDGSRAITDLVTPVRIRCMNTQNYALANHQQMWSVKHTESMEGKIAEARHALELTMKYAAGLEAEMDQLINQQFTRGDFEKMTTLLVPATTGGGLQTRMAMIGTLETSETIDDAWRYTKWGAINAVTEFIDWIQPVRETKDAPIDRTHRTWFGPGKAIKQKAHDLLVAV